MTKMGRWITSQMPNWIFLKRFKKKKNRWGFSFIVYRTNCTVVGHCYKPHLKMTLHVVTLLRFQSFFFLPQMKWRLFFIFIILPCFEYLHYNKWKHLQGTELFYFSFNYNFFYFKSMRNHVRIPSQKPWVAEINRLKIF